MDRISNAKYSVVPVLHAGRAGFPHLHNLALTPLDIAVRLDRKTRRLELTGNDIITFSVNIYSCSVTTSLHGGAVPQLRNFALTP